MSIETEIKYKVNKILDNCDYKIKITQIYFNGQTRFSILNDIFLGLDMNTISTFRARIIEGEDTKYIITLKGPSNDGYSRSEYEKEVSKEVFDKLTNDNILSVVLKNRYVKNVKEYKFEIDEYLNLKTKLITLEVELKSQELSSIYLEKAKIESILKELDIDYLDVTMDYRYKNSNITKYF